MQTEDLQLPITNWTEGDSPTNRQLAISIWKFLATHTGAILIFLTLLGAIPRFAWLDRPPLWGDEAATYARVCGTFEQLLRELSVWGFGPLHYLMYWEIRQHTPLTPIVMRLPVAIAGTLMVPAMYFLAVQLLPRKTALLAATLTAFSAYMLNYSRDAKMYSETWLCVALHLGGLFWWLRTRKAIAWWTWLASGVIMLGLQAVAGVLLPIELLIVLTSRNQYWKSFGVLLLTIVWLPLIPLLIVLRWVRLQKFSERIAMGRWLQRQYRQFHWPPLFWWSVGCCVMLIGPYIYYTQFNVYLQYITPRQNHDARWMRSGLEWVEYYNYGRDGLDLLKYTGSAFLDNWEWPRIGNQPQIPPLALKLLKSSTIALFALLLLGILPWRLIGKDNDLSRIIGPHLRGILWLALWIVLPCYGFYCISTKNAAWPIDWVGDALLKHPPAIAWPLANNIAQWNDAAVRNKFFHGWSDSLSQFIHALTASNVQWWTIILILGASAAWLALWRYDWKNRLRRVAIVLQIIILLFVVCTIERLAIAQPMPGSVWMPRYLGTVWPALAIVMAVLFLRLPTRPLRIAAISLFIIVNLAQHGARIFASSEPPSDLMAHDLVISQPPNTTYRMYYRISRQGMGDPGTGTLYSRAAAYYLQLYSGRPATFAGLDIDYADSFEIWSGLSFIPFESYVSHTMQSASQVKQIFVWDEPPKTAPPTDPLLQMLGPQWTLLSQENFVARDHWTWASMYTVRRRVYQRLESPTTNRGS